jgi:1-acyl-sn-glycerol-3-phosphate acyltransferase
MCSLTPPAPTPTAPTPQEMKKKYKVEDTLQDSSLIPTLGVTLWLGWNGGVLWLIILAIFVPSNLVRAIIIGMFILSLILPGDSPKSFSPRIGNFIMQNAKKYFGLKTTIEDEDAIDKYQNSKGVIFASEPHDILPYSVFCFNPCLHMLSGKIGQDGAALMTSAVFKIPFMKQVYTWVGGDSVDKHTFRKRLQDRKSLVFCPGGVQEILFIDPNEPTDLVLFLKSRKGFIKLALETGSPIVPVFSFHLDGSYKYFLPRGKFVESLARTIGFLPLFFWGRFCIPFGIPYPKKISVVLGPPIDIPQVNEKDINPAIVDKYHDIFIQEITALFERHKFEEGYGHRTLKII